MDYAVMPGIFVTFSAAIAVAQKSTPQEAFQPILPVGYFLTPMTTDSEIIIVVLARYCSRGRAY
jgi:hypothetical protein